MSKKTLVSFKTINAVSMAADVTSSVTSIQYLDNIGLQLVFTGTPTGTFAVQVSADYLADYLGNVINTGNWVAIPLSPSPVASGSASSIYIDMNQLSAPYIRVVYTRTSGTGTLSATITGKQI